MLLVLIIILFSVIRYEPHLISPRHNIQESNPRCDNGLYVMTSLRGDKVEPKWKSPMIHDTSGNLVWMDPSHGETFGLSVQRYKKRDYLAFWERNDSLRHGEGTYIMLDSLYKQVYNFTAGNGRLGVFHDFTITEHGTALLTQYRYEEGGWGIGLHPQSYIWDSAFQEIDIETSEVLVEWHAYDHVDVNKSDFPSGSSGRANGFILWELGGRRNSFIDLSEGNATKFGWQHDARWTADHTRIDHSRGIHIALDFVTMTATLETSYVNPRKIISDSQGSMQTLPSGNVLILSGTDITLRGRNSKFFDTGAVQTYKVLKYPWVGNPTTRPKVRSLGGWVYVSWKGATEVRAWVLKGLDEAGGELKDENVRAERMGFETRLNVDSRKWNFVKAVAVDVDGKVCGELEAVP
ncbi:hypothetical protein BKA65DRAFT_528614 [Rhexocercosporidium sp. MPI-PUGE-AT-0058]|nr:hypothetical protein BKA65DRAFT_528614 [Rhexocercosporidium sp. MPI-PUGE-AT-0058]